MSLKSKKYLSIAAASIIGAGILSPMAMAQETSEKYYETDSGYCRDGQWHWNNGNDSDNEGEKKYDCVSDIVLDTRGYVNVQSVGKYRTQEGAKPREDNTSRLTWDVEKVLNSFKAIKRIPKNSPENVDQGGYNTDYEKDLTWIFVPKEVKNIELFNLSLPSGTPNEHRKLNVKKGIPSSLEDFGEVHSPLKDVRYKQKYEAIRKNAFMMSAGEARKEILGDNVGLTPEDDDKYNAIVIANHSFYPGSIRVTGEIDVSDAKSDVYVPLRATRKISAFTEDGKSIVSLGEFDWANMGKLPDFSITDEKVNEKTAKLYQDPLNEKAGLVGTPECKVTIDDRVQFKKNGSSSGDRITIEDAEPGERTIPEKSIEKIIEKLYPSLYKEVQNGRSSVGGRSIEDYYYDDYCDQSAHRIVVEYKEETAPSTEKEKDNIEKEENNTDKTNDKTTEDVNNDSNQTENNVEDTKVDSPKESENKNTEKESNTDSQSVGTDTKPEKDEKQPDNTQSDNNTSTEEKTEKDTLDIEPNNAQEQDAISNDSITTQPSQNNVVPVQSNQSHYNNSEKKNYPLTNKEDSTSRSTVYVDDTESSENGLKVNTGGKVSNSLWSRIASIF